MKELQEILFHACSQKRPGAGLQDAEAQQLTGSEALFARCVTQGRLQEAMSLVVSTGVMFSVPLFAFLRVFDLLAVSH